MVDEILKKLLASDLLSEETKTTLTEQFKSALEGFLAEERQKIEVEVNTRLTEEFVKAREELVEAVNTKLDTVVEAEFAELRQDIEQFRDLEVEFAEKLVEEKEQLAVRFGSEMDELVDKLDRFLDQRIDAEFDELKEDIEDAKRQALGRKILEAFEAEYKAVRKDDSAAVARELAEAKEKLADARKQLAEQERQRVAESHKAKLDELLEPLTGLTRESMKIVLQNVPTEKLEESYKVYLGRILKESSVETSVVEKPVLTEGKVVTGNEVDQTPTATATDPSSDILVRMRRLAGLATPS